MTLPSYRCCEDCVCECGCPQVIGQGHGHCWVVTVPRTFRRQCTGQEHKYEACLDLPVSENRQEVDTGLSHGASSMSDLKHTGMIKLNTARVLRFANCSHKFQISNITMNSITEPRTFGMNL
jgi:hypothetical protein